MMTYKQAVTAILWVLFFHALGMLALYSWYPYYDVFMHFAGGLAMAVLGFAMWDSLVRSVTFTNKNPWLKDGFTAFCILGFVALIGIGWEWFEYGFDAVAAVRLSWGLAQTSLADTMADLFLDLLGGLAVVMHRKV